MAHNIQEVRHVKHMEKTIIKFVTGLSVNAAALRKGRINDMVK
jgi:hypothetical protein